jgi:hypothetical protein
MKQPIETALNKNRRQRSMIKGETTGAKPV